MKLLIVLAVLVASVLESSASRLCDCPPINDPVCASNKKIYKNVCFMRCDIEHQGPPLRVINKGAYCPICGACLGPPVCGANGKTYMSICALNCDWLEDTKKAYDGPCRKKNRSRYSYNNPLYS